MTGSVVDASVVVKRLIREEHSERARALFADAARRGEPLVVPPLMLSEVTNALYQRMRRQASGMSETDAQQSLARLLGLPIRIAAPADLYPRTLAFARMHGLRATYDSTYVVLAEIIGVELWTADERLVRELGGAAPWVRWIGDYHLAAR
jgi:predicted nucleic acid-binding protein